MNSIKNWLYFRKLRTAVRRIQSGDTSSKTLLLLLEGWNNGGYASRPEYLERIAEVAKTRRFFLECGSGASTILLAAMGAHVTSLEHHADWLAKVRHTLDRLGLKAALVHAPLRSYGDFDWYEFPSQPIHFFTAVVCDGPPSTTRGGRYGLLPVAQDALNAECIILLDDTVREDEQVIAQRWCREFGMNFVSHGAFGELRQSHSLV